MLLFFCAHCTFEKFCFLQFHLSSFLCYADQQRNMLMAKSMKKMLSQTFSVFEPEQCLEMGNYMFSFDRNFIIF